MSNKNRNKIRNKKQQKSLNKQQTACLKKWDMSLVYFCVLGVYMCFVCILDDNLIFLQI